MGDLVTTDLRGAWLGNRGILHSAPEGEPAVVVRNHASRAWITCALTFKDRRLPQWQPHHFTVLFFHDEALSLAAGHRPCALCRRPDYTAYRAALAAQADDPPSSAAMLDRRLHAERLHRGPWRRRLHPAVWAQVPSGAFVVVDDAPSLVLGDRIVPWSPQGYGAPARRPPRGRVEVLTPPSSVAALVGGYRPQIDPGPTSAQGAWTDGTQPTWSR